MNNAGLPHGFEWTERGTIRPVNYLCGHCRSAWAKDAGLRDNRERASLQGPLWTYKGLYRARYEPSMYWPSSYEQGLP